MTYTPYNSARYVEGKHRLLTGLSPEAIIQERIRLWKEHRFPDRSIQQVLSFYGKPGIGKSWFLQHIAEINPEAVFIDLDDRKKAATAEQFIFDVSGLLPSTLASRRYLLLIDHVPDVMTDGALRIFQERILFPMLEAGSLFVLACQYQRTWAWAASFPHPPSPLTLSGFDRQGRKELYRKYEIGGNPRDPYQSLFEVPPLLAELKRENSDDIVIAEAYLEYWLSQVAPVPKNKLDDELKLAGALAWLPSLADAQGMIVIIDLLGRDDDYINVLERFDRRQWISPSDVWEEPVRTFLRDWLTGKYPELAKKLSEKFGR